MGNAITDHVTKHAYHLMVGADDGKLDDDTTSNPQDYLWYFLLLVASPQIAAFGYVAFIGFLIFVNVSIMASVYFI